MTANSRLVILFLVAGTLFSCATNSFRSKTYRNMLVASAVGLAMGQQKEQNKVGYSMAYAGTLAAVAAIASIEYYDPDKELEKRTGVSKDIARSLESALGGKSRGLSYSEEDEEVVMRKFREKSGQSLKNFNSLPLKYKNLITPGEWKISQIDEWEQVDDYTFVHKTELFEVTPPEVKINQ